MPPLPDPVQLLELRSTWLSLGELALLAAAGGLLGSFAVLRRLAFFSHAVGTATFPGSVLAQAAGFSPRLAALVVAGGFSVGAERGGRDGADPGGPATGLMLVGALAAGTILASDVFRSGAGVDRLLFGSVVAVRPVDLVVPACAAAGAALVTAALGRAWVTVAFDPTGAPALGLPARGLDLALLLALGAGVVAALPAVGSLLATSLFVVPAAVALLLARGAGSLVALAVGIALAQSVLGLYGSIWLDVPPGPAIAVLGALAYAAVALAPRPGWARAEAAA